MESTQTTSWHSPSPTKPPKRCGNDEKNKPGPGTSPSAPSTRSPSPCSKRTYWTRGSPSGRDHQQGNQQSGASRISGLPITHNPPGTSGTLPAFSGIFFLYNFLVRDPGKRVQCAGCAGTRISCRMGDCGVRLSYAKPPIFSDVTVGTVDPPSKPLPWSSSPD